VDRVGVFGMNLFALSRYSSHGGQRDVEAIAIREITSVQDRPIDAGGELIARIASGDRDALTELYHHERHALFAYLLHLMGDAGRAEDVLQETLVAVWKSAGSFAGRSSARTWLIGIARRQAHNALRRRSLPRADIAAAANVPGTLPQPEEHVIAAAVREDVATAVARLPMERREILLLAFAHDLSYQEIADVLGIPLGTVKSRLNHAKRSLRELLGTNQEAAR
jgi:RNA polymerase sigma factor (sigma-70 family)